MNEDRIIFPITPQTHVRTTQNTKILFRVPETCIKLKKKKPCAMFRKTGDCKHVLSKAGKRRKRRLERYNQYKADLLTLAKVLQFQLPVAGWSLYFYMPMPIRWSDRVKRQMHGQLHMREPDIDNLLKAFFDALSITDEQVCQMSGMGKFWTNDLEGYIEVLINQPIYNPMDVQFIDQGLIMKAPKRKWEKDQSKPDGRKNRQPKPLKLIGQELLFIREDAIK